MFDILISYSGDNRYQNSQLSVRCELDHLISMVHPSSSSFKHPISTGRMCSNIWLILIFPCISRIAGGGDPETDGYGRQKQYLKHVFEVCGSVRIFRWDSVG